MDVKRRDVSQTRPLAERKFPRLKGMVDRLRRPAVLATLVGATLTVSVSCSDDPETGTGGGGTTATGGGGTTGSGGNGGSLCNLYGEGHDNRKTFTLGEGHKPECGDYILIFTRQMELSTGMRAVFAFLHATSPTGSDFIGFNIGDQKSQDVPGVGPTLFELCGTTGGECDYHSGSPTGDLSCTATLASDRALGCN